MRVFLLCLLCLALPPAAAAQHEIPYSGRLTQSGVPVEGRVLLTFNLYDSPLTPTPLASYAESVTVTNGIFHHRMVFSEADFEGGAYLRWLGVALGSDPEMQPRTFVGRVPYAIHSSRALTSGYADYSIQAESVAPSAMPGLSFRDGPHSGVSLPLQSTAWVLVDSLDMPAPNQGYAVVEFRGQATDSPNDTEAIFQYVLTENPFPNASDTPFIHEDKIDRAVASGYATGPVHASRVFQIFGGAPSPRYRLFARHGQNFFGGVTVEIKRMSMYGMFYFQRYEN